ncbi:hypothetical protein Taro_018463, partial [Colocasia esculenta]|nr:hypothetical protein [Colocasia esculenta]
LLCWALLLRLRGSPQAAAPAMKCFHFSGNERGGGGGGGVGNGARVSRVSWSRSLSVASSSCDTRPSVFDSDAGREDGPEFFSGHELARRLEELRVFAFDELRAATRGFSRALVIGEGGFGCVYRGVVSASGVEGGEMMEVAVKQLNRSGMQARFLSEYPRFLCSFLLCTILNNADGSCWISMQGHKEWITEVNFLGIVSHPNLVKLIGYCAEDDERGIQRLLVYEFMPNKSLEDHLLARVQTPLSWPLRLKVSQGAARGLAYLHEEMDFQLIFRDFKTSNILLDEDFNAKLSDFGMARQGPTEGVGHVLTAVVGTVGYAAPEYVQTGRLTAKSDVWSFGVVLYELITGRRSLDRNLPRSEQKLLQWVKPYATDPKRLHVIIDPRLEGQYCLKSIQMLVGLANKCLLKQPKSRPKMSEVVEMLGQIIDMLDSEVAETSDRSESMDTDNSDTAEISKEGSSFRRRAFDIRELMSLRNRSVGKLDWRALTPGLSRTWC